MLPDVLRATGYKSYRDDLERLLGISPDASAADITASIEAGIPVQRIEALVSLSALSVPERDKIIPPRTLKHRIEKCDPLSVSEGDRLFRVCHVIAMANVTFKNLEKATRWLSKPKERFAGRSPLDMLGSTPGTALVEEMTIQLAEGYSF